MSSVNSEWWFYGWDRLRDCSLMNLRMNPKWWQSIRKDYILRNRTQFASSLNSSIQAQPVEVATIEKEKEKEKDEEKDKEDKENKETEFSRFIRPKSPPAWLIVSAFFFLYLCPAFF